jgi:hypothetical protein
MHALVTAATVWTHNACVVLPVCASPQILLRHEPIEGTTSRRFYQPRGAPHFGWVDPPPGAQEEQYWAPKHPDQPSVQVCVCVLEYYMQV